MGFPSPANDFAERRLTINDLCQIDENCITIETTAGYAVINRSLRVQQGNTVLIEHCGRTQFAKLMGKALITPDGEALEGETLDDVSVAGVVTHLVNKVPRGDDEIPTI